MPLPCRLKFIACAYLCIAPALTANAFTVTFTEDAAGMGLAYFGQTFGHSFGDFDGDGFADLYVSNHGIQTTIYKNNAGLGFTNINAQVSASLTGDVHSGAWGDFDNDGDRDLLFLEGASGGVLPSPSRLLVNTGGNFVDAASTWNLEQEFARARTPHWFDWNNDGLLDVSFANWPRGDGVSPTAIYTRSGSTFVLENDNANYHPSGSNNFTALVKTTTQDEPVLLVNTVFGFPEGMFDTGQLPFTNVASTLGMPSIGASWDFVAEDFDGDLTQEIFFPRQFERSEAVQTASDAISASLFGINGVLQGFNFESTGPISFDIGPTWGIPLTTIAIGANELHPPDHVFTLDATNPDNWGAPPQNPVLSRMYIYYDNVAGRWHVESSHLLRPTMIVTTSGAFNDIQMIGVPNDPAGQLTYLLKQVGGVYTNIATPSGLTGAYPCMTVGAADFDNDMDADIYMACKGGATNLDNILLENDGTGQFTLVAGAAGATGTSVGRADTMALADVDNNGFIDILVANGFGNRPTGDGPTELFMNGGNANHWLHIELEGVTVNRDGVGAWVVVTAGGIAQSRLQDNGARRYGQDHQRLHFGLGNNTVIDEISIRWPGGQMQTLTNVAADQILTVVQEADTDGDNISDSSDNCQLVSNPLQIDGDGDGFGNLCDTDLTNDLVTNFLDVSEFSNRFGSADPAADFNSDGAVNFLDAALFPDYFGLPPGP